MRKARNLAFQKLHKYQTARFLAFKENKISVSLNERTQDVLTEFWQRVPSQVPGIPLEGLRRLSVAYLSLLLVEESTRVLVLDSVLVREGLGRDLLIGDRVVGSRLKIKKQDAKGQVI